MRKAIGATYLVAVHLALAYLLLKADPPPREVIVRAPPVTGQSYFTSTRQVHRNVDPFVPEGTTLFLGDSITQQLRVEDIVSRAVNFGIGAQRSDQLLDDIAVYGSMSRAARVVLTIGTNDLRHDRDADIGARYDALLAKIPAPVVMSSVFPMPRLAPERVTAVVEAGRQACARRPRCTFVDAYAALKDDAAALQPDGVHLSPGGYEKWSAALRAALPRADPSLPATPQ